MKKLPSAIVCGFLLYSFLFAQVNFRVVTYNALKYPDSNNGNRKQYFHTVFDAVNPDVVLVQELISEAGADSLLHALNANGQEYESVPFINGADTDNMLYFRTSKVGFISQDTIKTDVREISEYVVTIGGNEVRFFVCHLKASQGAENEQERLAEVTILRAYLNTLPAGTELIIAGDMNLYTSDEPAYKKFVDDEGDNGRCEDLVGPAGVGNWHDNSDYIPYHTQSSRADVVGSGASGGIDDRFDFIFTNFGINNGTGIEYVENTYTSFGNDNNHFNQSVNDGNNSMVPDSVADALYYASDHLPVYADFVSLEPTNSDDNTSEISATLLLRQNYLNPLSPSVTVSYTLPISDFVILEILDMQGRKIQTLVSEYQKAATYTVNFNAGNLSSSLFFCKLELGNGLVETKKMFLIR